MDRAVKSKLLNWSKQFRNVFYLDSNKEENGSYPGIEYDFLLAVGNSLATVNNGPEEFDNLIESKSWYFSLIGYDVKNRLENLKSQNPDFLQFPDSFFLKPETVIYSKDGKWEIESASKKSSEILNEIENSEVEFADIQTGSIWFKPRMSKEEYLRRVSSIKNLIRRGDIYELNFCQEFYAEKTLIQPEKVFLDLIGISPMPFSAYVKLDDQYILGASPERFLKKKGPQLISQPIKGTIKRHTISKLDYELKNTLRNSEKEQSENVMIVDLVRNDLSRIARPETVKVDELFGVYPFRQMHQMISTVSCRIPENTSLLEIIKATFPMGSMTGAPKISAMQIIEEYETMKRGAFSGSIGFVNPLGDFDFNVVIRSLLYNQKSQYLSFSAGSAITWLCDPEKEYEECLLKFKAVSDLFHNWGG